MTKIQGVEVERCRSCGRDDIQGFADGDVEGSIVRVECDCGASGSYAESIDDAADVWNDAQRPGDATRKVLEALAGYIAGDLECCINIDPGGGEGGRSMLERSIIAEALRENGIEPPA